MDIKIRAFLLIFIAVIACTSALRAEYPLNYSASLTANAGSGNFAPYYMASNIHGVVTQPYSTLLRGSIYKELTTKSRFSYGFGLDIIGGYSSGTDYKKFDVSKNLFYYKKEYPASVWIQQLFGEVKYRGVFITLGMKERGSALLNQQLSSGDMLWSGNTRPMPEVRLGFIDFQNIPFTNGWVQIQGEFGYGKNLDSKWLENHYNYYNSFINTGSWSSYKRLYFRTKPSQPVSLTIGMQASTQFGGNVKYYKQGKISLEKDIKLGIKDFFKALIPIGGASSGSLEGDEYYAGNHIGSWDVMLQYRLDDKNTLKGYVQFPWEDGSGIGKLNGFDGLYGIEYSASEPQIINGAVIEYIDLRNQSGPIHWAPGDIRDGETTIKNPATGADDYYNNYMYNGYSYFGMSMGSAFVKSPLYNTNGFMRFTDNRIQGFHIGVSGNITDDLQYRLLVSYRTSLGTPFVPSITKRDDTSVMLEGVYVLPKIPQLTLKGQVALDRGTLYGNNFGVLLSASYRGLLKL